MFTAAGILGLLWLAWQNWSPTQRAFAALEKATTAAERPVDRQYHVVTDYIGRDGMKHFLEGKLYVRGGERLALRHPGLAGDFWLGTDGQKGWFLPALGSPRFFENLDDVWKQTNQDRDKSAQAAGLPDLSVAGILSRLRGRYSIEWLPDEPIGGGATGGGAMNCWRMRAWRVNESDIEPATVDVWIDQRENLAIQVHLDWRREDGRRGVSQVRLEYEGSSPLPDSWYEAQGHAK